MKTKIKSKKSRPSGSYHLVTSQDVHTEIKSLAEGNFTSVKIMTQVLLENAIDLFKAGKIPFRA